MNISENLEIANMPLTEEEKIQNLIDDLKIYASESEIPYPIMCDALVDAITIEREEARWNETTKAGNPENLESGVLAVTRVITEKMATDKVYARFISMFELANRILREIYINESNDANFAKQVLLASKSRTFLAKALGVDLENPASL